MLRLRMEKQQQPLDCFLLEEDLEGMVDGWSFEERKGNLLFQLPLANPRVPLVGPLRRATHVGILSTGGHVSQIVCSDPD